jgi:predicted acyltransferase
MATSSKRILALDILRGITIAGMILVNNPGSWSHVYAPLRHAEWIGLTPTDLVFPFFMFIMGISTFISLRKFDFKFSGATLWKVVKRTFVIFFIGLVLTWLSLSIGTFRGLAGEDMGFWAKLGSATTNFGHLRILGVLQRLALAYCITALVAITLKHKYIPWIIAGTSVGYFMVLLFGHGFEFSESNIVGVVDRAILGVGHMYRDNGLVLDPEGLLSTIPAACHVLLGFWCGKIMLGTSDNGERMKRLFIMGAIMTFSGFLLSYGCPIIKKVWTPTYMLVTCGLASTLLALLVWIIDIKGYKKWSRFFESFGVNPLFIYVLAGVLSIVLGSVTFSYDGGIISLQGFIYGVCLRPWLGATFGSLVFALLFVALNWAIGHILYKKKIYIKI